MDKLSKTKQTFLEDVEQVLPETSSFLFGFGDEVLFSDGEILEPSPHLQNAFGIPELSSFGSMELLDREETFTVLGRAVRISEYSETVYVLSQNSKLFFAVESSLRKAPTFLFSIGDKVIVSHFVFFPSPEFDKIFNIPKNASLKGGFIEHPFKAVVIERTRKSPFPQRDEIVYLVQSGDTLFYAPASSLS